MLCYLLPHALNISKLTITPTPAYGYGAFVLTDQQTGMQYRKVVANGLGYYGVSQGNYHVMYDTSGNILDPASHAEQTKQMIADDNYHKSIPVTKIKGEATLAIFPIAGAVVFFLGAKLFGASTGGTIAATLVGAAIGYIAPQALAATALS